jgi:hypothetical protein
LPTALLKGVSANNGAVAAVIEPVFTALSTA